MQGWGFVHLTSLLYHPYLVCILFGMLFIYNSEYVAPLHRCTAAHCAPLFVVTWLGTSIRRSSDHRNLCSDWIQSEIEWMGRIGQMNLANTRSRDFETLRNPGKKDILRGVRVWITRLKEREVSWGREGSYSWRGHSAMNKICSEIISRVYATLNTTIVLHCLLCLKAKHEVQSPESQY